MSIIKIREAKPRDVDLLLELSKRVTNYNNRKFMSDELVDKFLASDFFEEEITKNIENMHIITVSGIIVGLCTWFDNQLVSFMIDPDYQGDGYSYILLQDMMRLKLEEYDELYLECFEANIVANKFYRKNKWELTNYVLDETTGLRKCVYKYFKGSSVI